MTERAETAERQVDVAVAHIVANRPKVEFAEAVAASEGTFTLRNTARMLGVGETVFFKRLRERFLFDEGGALVPRASYRRKGLFVVRVHQLDDNRIRPQTLVTGKGLAALRAFFMSGKGLLSGLNGLPAELEGPASRKLIEG